MQSPNLLLPPLVVSNFLQHFQSMMGQYGLYQHATLRVPLLAEGYCTDDNARAVNMLIGLKGLVSERDNQLVDTLLERCWNFVVEAQIEPGKFLNFRTSDGNWLPADQSEDMYARVVRAAVAMVGSSNEKHVAEAKSILKNLHERMYAFIAIRAQAETVIALNQLQVSQQSAKQINILALHQLEKMMQFWTENSSEQWPWFESTATYANAIIPYGLLAGLKLRSDKGMNQALHASTKFLVHATVKNDMFIPIGSRGWFPKGGEPSTDNQQAIEAALMFEFLIEYQLEFPELVTTDQVIAPYRWFFGHNTGGVVLAQPETGSCLDGLFKNGPNKNQGAESMLAYQMVEVLARKSPGAIQERIIRTMQDAV